MNIIVRGAIIFFLLFGCFSGNTQDAVSPFQWNVTSKKISSNQYEVIFSSQGNKAWQLYAPNQVLGDVPTTELQFADSAIKSSKSIKASGVLKREISTI